MEWTSKSLPYLTARPPGAADAWTEEAAANGRRGGQRIAHAGEVAAPAEVAAMLGLPVGSTVVMRRRIIELDGEPTELTNTYYPLEIAGGTALAGTAKIRGGAVTLLAALGHVGVRVVEDVTARRRWRRSASDCASRRANRCPSGPHDLRRGGPPPPGGPDPDARRTTAIALRDQARPFTARLTGAPAEAWTTRTGPAPASSVPLSHSRVTPWASQWLVESVAMHGNIRQCP
ncbi:UTRA domain-containing protein [Streptomyces sp. CG 926]|nr:UTRA domain-containing protein [Streptomyces sp. CG 926]